MIMNIKKLFQIIVVLFFAVSAHAMEIKGTIELQDDWQPIVYLASLNSPENLFVASPDFIIAESFIQPDGTFLINTTSIPADKRFYRLYLVKGKNSLVEFNALAHRNYQHLLLDRNSQIEIKAKVAGNSLIIKSLSGSEENNEILAFDKELAKRRQQFTNDLTKAKREYLTQDLGGFIKGFVNETSNSLVGLYALYHLDEKDVNFLRNSDFYFDFQEKIEAQYPDSYYARAYSELLESLTGFRDLVCEMPGIQPKWKDNLLIAQGIIIFVLLLTIVFLLVYLRKNNLQKQKSENEEWQDSFSNLTQKEREILQLLAEGKTNKEIAAQLFVELSTVKTHINSIYKQLKVTNRKEAIEYCHSLKPNS